MKAGTAAFVSFVFLTACATPPTKEELANLDYGACPVGYEEIIRPEFKSGLLTAYEGEPLIWAPRQYWYKDPLLGGKVLAGYLVPVTAEQTRGNQLSHGRQLYGFLFKNGELAKKLNPSIMQYLSIEDAVGPIPKDEREWTLGHSASNASQSVLEFVPPGETVQNWTELVTLQAINHPPGVAPSLLADRVAEESRKSCADVTQSVISQTPTAMLFERTMESCAPVRNEYSIVKLMQSFRAVHIVTYAKTTPLSAAERDKWIGIVRATELMNECALSKP